MIQPWITLLVAIFYVLLLFVVASYGDRKIVGMKTLVASLISMHLVWLFIVPHGRSLARLV